MSDSRLGVGIVGLGNISEIHAQAIENSKQGNVVAAYSSSEEKGQDFGDKYKARSYTSYEEFLSNPDLDVVSICTPSGTHLDFGKTAAEAGKHVVVEKPIEVTLERGNSLIESCETNGVKLAIIYQSRFTKDAIEMKQTIDQGDIGELFMASATVKWFRDQKYFKNAPWRGTLKLDGGGAVINQSIHTIDLLQWMLGDLDSIQAYKDTLTHEGIEGEDNAAAAFRFKSGVMGTFIASTSMVPPHPRKIEIHGTKGTALLDETTFRILRTEEDLDTSGQTKDPAGAKSPMANLQYTAHMDQFDQIFEAIRNNEEPPVSGPDSMKSLAFVAGLYKSAETGQLVSLDGLIEEYS